MVMVPPLAPAGVDPGALLPVPPPVVGAAVVADAAVVAVVLSVLLSSLPHAAAISARPAASATTATRPFLVFTFSAPPVETEGGISPGPTTTRGSAAYEAQASSSHRPPRSV